MESRPFTVISPTLDGDVLEVLARGDVELTGRQVAALTRVGSPAGIQDALHRLVRQGIVLQRPAGSAYLYRLNREHVAAAAIEQLANLPAATVERVRGLIAQWAIATPIALLFGSVARGEASVESDVDLLVIRPGGIDGDDPRWTSQLAQLGSRVSAWTGNDARVLEYGEEELETSGPVEGALVAAAEEGIDLVPSARSRLRRVTRGGS